MRLPVMPPVSPMLAKAVPTIPPGASYEPKWDGFRCILFRDGDEMELGSRNERPLTRYFPEIVAAAARELPPRCVIDGEIVIAGESGLDFEALQLRLHPAVSRVTLLAERTPAAFIAFDLLALGEDNLLAHPFRERRAALVQAMRGGGAGITCHLTPATTDPATAARWFTEFEGAGCDGLIAKPLDAAYQPDKRAMFKVKHARTADCVVAGYRPHKSGPQAVGSLLLGLYRDDGALTPVGVVGAFTMARRRELFTELQPLVSTFDGHPWNWADAVPVESPRATNSRWNPDKSLSFVPLRPQRVLEVRYDHMEGHRFRHTAQFGRWRPDRDPLTCTYAQLETPTAFRLEDVIAGLGRPAHRFGSRAGTPGDAD